ncbi:MAG: ergothioneine biosynthesis protein EgtB [Labilithrix sp.]|nr:ergothioneine biosynthesis protein EgtB [Labilithrix sp.]MCW5810159.1 ergothioneine biosynthesis protein EgtB [Labilithrix sp.]
MHRRIEDLAGLVARVLTTRRATIALAEPLEQEDWVAQSMPDASPVKWHLAHTTWFFERFVLGALGFEPVDPRNDYLFNSYYESVGKRVERAKRGLLTRPTAREVLAYRRTIDERLAALEGSPRLAEVGAALELGLHHEEQHQELLLTDVKHLLSENPLAPAYRRGHSPAPRPAPQLAWRDFAGGVAEIGHRGSAFSFDNERPRHKVYLAPFRIATRLVTAGEYRAFVASGGYRKPELWLSEGWAWIQAGAHAAPLYWRDGMHFTLDGERAIDDAEPVTHVTYYEADAFARWAGARLPTEAEWEHAAADATPGGFVEDGHLHPRVAAEGFTQMLGDAWEWTASAYAPYPGFAPLEGAFGEYNGKFMVSQMVLRGGSCATPRGHARTTYRNFFPPSAAWQFSGIRLAKDGA